MHRVLAMAVVVLAMSGCGDEEAPVEVNARGSIDAVGRSGERSLDARYSSKLDDESCEVLDGRSACVLVECTPDPERAYANAGEVTVGDDVLERAEDGSYALVVPEELVPGELLAMRASGTSRVPEHSGSVVVPERMELTSVLEDPLVVDPGADLVLTWASLESDRVSLAMTFGDREIRCTSSAGVGELTIASRLLAGLPDGATGSYGLTNENITDSSVTGWRIWLAAHQVVAEGSVDLASSE
jgi:hypothetical protein